MLRIRPKVSNLADWVSFIFCLWWIGLVISPNWVVIENYFPESGKHLLLVLSARQAERARTGLPAAWRKSMYASLAPRTGLRRPRAVSPSRPPPERQLSRNP